MRFIETPIFTKAIDELLDGDEYRAMQMALLARPELGTVLRGGGGLRKMRWARTGSGKRGGLRVIYYWDEPTETFYLLFVHPQSARDDLTTKQLRVLSRLVGEEFP